MPSWRRARATSPIRPTGWTAVGPRIVGGLRDLESGPTAVQPVGLIGLVALARLQLGIEPGAPVAFHLFDLAVGNDALGNQFFGIDLQRRRMGLNPLVHQRLR